MSALFRLFKLIAPLTGVMFAAICLGVLGQLTVIALPVIAITGLLTDPSNFTNYLWPILICGFLRGPLHYGEHYCNHLIAFNLLALLRQKVFSALRRLSPAILENKSKGDLIALVTSDIEMLELFYAHTISPVAIATLVSIMVAGVLAWLSPWLGLWALLGYLLIGYLFPLVSHHIMDARGLQVRNQLGQLSSYVLDSLYGLGELLQFKGMPKRLQSLTHQTKALNHTQGQISLGTGLQNAAIYLVVFGFSLGTLLIAYALHLSPVTIIIATVIVLSSFGPVIALSSLTAGLSQTIGAAQRLIDLLDENPVVQEVEQGQQPTFDQAQLTNVTFTYPDTVNPVIQKLNLTIPKGQIMGIHAPSGTGKSTILKLLAHFYDPDTGQVTINKTSLTKINSNYLRQMESYVSQETWLFQDTIANNLKLGNPQASDQEIQLVAQQAGIANYIESLPEQYQTKLSELADSISEGQKQRLGIARAFLHEGELLLLDEITANLDVLNEAIILKSLRKIAKEKTVVIVSHRLSTLSIADQIYELTL